MKLKAFELGTFLKLGLPYVFFFFAPITWSIVGIGVLVFADVFTGIAAAKNRGERIHSKGMSRTIGKMLYYTIAIVLSRVMELTFISWLPIAQLTSGYIAVVEFKSNLENIAQITGVDVWNHLKDKFEDNFGRKGAKDK
jgi:DNA integrity scanning protein DisA with diadenylate cyclase activity